MVNDGGLSWAGRLADDGASRQVSSGTSAAKNPVIQIVIRAVRKPLVSVLRKNRRAVEASVMGKHNARGGIGPQGRKSPLRICAAWNRLQVVNSIVSNDRIDCAPKYDRTRVIIRDNIAAVVDLAVLNDDTIDGPAKR